MDENRLDFSIQAHEKSEDFIKIREVLDRGNAWIDFDKGHDLIKSQFPNLHQLDGYFGKITYGFIARKESPRSGEILELFRRYEKSGFLDSLRRKYSPKTGRGGKTDAGKAQSITFDEFLPLMIVMLCACFGSIVILIVSFLFEWRKRSSDAS